MPYLPTSCCSGGQESCSGRLDRRPSEGWQIKLFSCRWKWLEIVDVAKKRAVMGSEGFDIVEPAHIGAHGFFAKAHPEKQRSLAALADLDSRDPLHVSATEVFVFC